eukprot:4906456-Prymnesium_polylepis.1
MEQIIRGFELKGMAHGITAEAGTDEAAEQLMMLLSIIKLQRAFRVIKAAYVQFGDQLFWRRGKKLALTGTIGFTGGTSANFIVCSHRSSAARLARYARFRWQIPRAEVIISVNGGTQATFELPNRLAAAVEHGLVSAVTSAQAMLITGGTDTGATKLAAGILQKHHVQRPVVGICPWSCINGRQLLD